MGELTSFQRNILHVLAEESRYGLAVKEELEQYYGQEINHGRLYPNLDELVDRDYVAKRSRDDRTNQYLLTDDGERALIREMEWKIPKFVGGESDRRQVIERLVREANPRQ